MASQKNTKLEREMQLKGWGYKELADAVGTDARNVGRWINGTNPQPYFRTKLCEVFGKNAEELGLIKETNGIAASNKGVDNTAPLPVSGGIFIKSSLDSNQDGIDSEEEVTSLLSGGDFLRQQEVDTQDLVTTEPEYRQEDKIVDSPRRSRFPVQKVPHKRILLLLVLSLLVLGGYILLHLSPRDQPVPVYQDPLTNSSNSSVRQSAKWDATASCQFLGDGFHIIDLYSKGRHSCLASNLNFSNIDLSVDVKMNHAAFVTIYLRGLAPPHAVITGDYVRINDSGKYSIQYKTSNQPGANAQDVPWTFPELRSLEAGDGNWNTMRIKLQGSSISLWFNRDRTSQPDFTGEAPPLSYSKGMIGFGAATSADVNNQKPPLDAVFRNLTIYDLSKQ